MIPRIAPPRSRHIRVITFRFMRSTGATNKDGMRAEARRHNRTHSVAPLAPLVRWAGSKRRLLPSLLKEVPPTFGTYYEPFAGSACLYLSLRPTRAVLGDINEGLMEAYRLLKSRPTLLHSKLSLLPSSRQYYKRLRNCRPGNMTSTERAVRFLYLNRHCFNGVYRENRKGRFNVPFGSKIPALHSHKQFLAFSRAIRPAELRTTDFETCLADVQPGDFVYLDPPYRKRATRNRGEYGSHAFQSNDIARFVSCLKELSARGAYVLASFHDSPILRREFPGWKLKTIRVARSVAGFTAKRRSARELILKNY